MFKRTLKYIDDPSSDARYNMLCKEINEAEGVGKNEKLDLLQSFITIENEKTLYQLSLETLKKIAECANLKPDLSGAFAGKLKKAAIIGEDNDKNHWLDALPPGQEGPQMGM